VLRYYWQITPSRHQFLDRRSFLAGGAAVLAGLAIPSTSAWGAPRILRRLSLRACRLNAGAVDPADPILALLDGQLGATETIDGLPFAAQWFGDTFPKNAIPFHTEPGSGLSATADESVDVAIIGGGLSGLAAATLMTLRAPDQTLALFDLRPRLGGSAMGESWRGMPYSLGSAYFMVPDPASDDELFYRTLGVYDHARVDAGGEFSIEYGDSIIQNICGDCSPSQALAYANYRAEVLRLGDEYPDIPIARQSRAVVESLDGLSFRESVRKAASQPLSPLVEQAIQAYCYSSFGVGWDELNAAAGWNFIAAEEFGRLILPGGNAGLAQLMFKRITRPPSTSAHPRPPITRVGAEVTDIRPRGDSVQVRWIDASGRRRCLRAKHAIVCISKHIVRHIMPTLAELDPAKEAACFQTPTVPYVVANVLLKTQVPSRFYDLFTIHDKAFPMNDEQCEGDRRVTDAVRSTFAAGSTRGGDLLTLYWPLPWHTARFTIIQENDWRTYAQIGAPQITRLLATLAIDPAQVEQVRLTRWGHAMPFMRPGFIASGVAELLRRPIEGRIHFANQDNWMLPAWETCLAEARFAVDSIVGG